MRINRIEKSEQVFLSKNFSKIVLDSISLSIEMRDKLKLRLAYTRKMIEIFVERIIRAVRLASQGNA